MQCYINIQTCIILFLYRHMNNVRYSLCAGAQSFNQNIHDNKIFRLEVRPDGGENKTKKLLRKSI